MDIMTPQSEPQWHVSEGSPDLRSPAEDAEWAQHMQLCSLRRSRRSESVPSLIRRGSFAFGQQQALKGVTAFHSRTEISAALQQTEKCVKKRLAGLNEERRSSLAHISRTPDLPPAHPEGRGDDNCIAVTRRGSGETEPQKSPPDSMMCHDQVGGAQNMQSLNLSFGTIEMASEDVDDIELMRTELEDRETQILQAVELGAGLLQQLEAERQQSSEREAEMQLAIDTLRSDVQKSLSTNTQYKTTIMYLLNVEEELVQRSIENIMLQNEVKDLGKQANDSSNTAWMQENLRKDAEMLGEREKVQKEQEKELSSKLKEVNGWKARASRCDRVNMELEKSREENLGLEREVRRITRLLHEREATVYGLKMELQKQTNTWNKETTEACLNRLKRETMRLRQEVDAHRTAAWTATQDARHLRGLLTAPEASHDMLDEHRSYVAALQRDALEKLYREIETMKEEMFSEMALWMAAVTDVAKDNRRQGDVLRRLRNDNSLLKDRVRSHEQMEIETSKGTARSRLVNSCQLIHKELQHIRDYSKSVKGQAAVRNITEKEFLELSTGLSSVCKLFLAFLQQLLSPSEKQCVGISLTDTTGVTVFESLQDTAPCTPSSRVTSAASPGARGSATRSPLTKKATKAPRSARYYP
eukprot:TRINITY_DN21239_c0_g1_i1.p1 TRINITY_DN21239_c0_g1~~TRINITY_DN21239_c0_g1_i1.p1  ORF type:complete len:643 (+),score=243.39 TRINITY_DN21239_c0_g1_i1:423-2351(+)